MATQLVWDSYLHMGMLELVTGSLPLLDELLNIS